VFESDEVVTLMAYLALGQRVAADPKEGPAERKSREGAAAWLGKIEPGSGTQATSLRLLRAVREGAPAEEIEAQVGRLLGKQNGDGGWGQDDALPSDAFATGQALYFLNLAGAGRDREEIRRGVAFLVGKQKENGSWPMTSRAHPGAKVFTNPVPITYFGSSWATLGLMRSLPE
jgi:hypothetical protein